MYRFSRFLLTALITVSVSAFSSPEWIPAEGSGYPANQFLTTKDLGTKLFLSEHPGKRPVVLLLHGSEGGSGFMEGNEQYLLLQKGYHVIGTTYFYGGPAFPGPGHASQIRLEPFLEQVQKYVAAHSDRLDGDNIGILGVSMGGGLALLLASLYPQFKFVVAIVPSDSVFQHPYPTAVSTWNYAGKDLPFIRFPIVAWPSILVWPSIRCALTYYPFLGLLWASGYFKNNRAWSETFWWLGTNLVSCDSMHTNAMEKAENLDDTLIRVENINGPVLLVSGLNDQLWPSAFMSNRAFTRLQKVNFTHPNCHIPFSGDHFSYATQEGYRIIFDALEIMLECERSECIKNGNDKEYSDKMQRLGSRKQEEATIVRNEL